MNSVYKVEIKNKINRIQSEIVALERQLIEKQGRLEGLKEALGVSPSIRSQVISENEDGSGERIVVRRRSLTDWAKKILMDNNNRPMHVNDILDKMGKDKSAKNSFCATVQKAIARGYFVRTAPNTIALNQNGDINGIPIQEKHPTT